MKNFKGIFPALLTPYTKSGEINKTSVNQLIELNTKKGVNGFYVGGSTGEGLMLTIDERKTLFKYAAEANQGKTTLIAHVGTINTEHAIEMAKYAQAVGFDAISAVAPYYYGFSYEAIKQYYLDIANSVDIPMIIYNFPNANGFNFTKAMAAQLLENEKFIGIKHTTSDLFMLSQFKTISDDIIVYNGYDEMLVAGLAMGADGGIGSTYNFMAEKYVALFNQFRAGNIAQAEAIQKQCNEIIVELIKYGVFVSEKAIMEIMGIEMNGCRKPFLPISKEGLLAMEKICKTL